MHKQIDPQDKSLKTLFQDFYRVPDYQREYVWGETDPKGTGGEEVEQFLSDIHNEFQNVTKDDAPEYFIGTIVVCCGKDDVFDLIDGQQRATTAYITLCAIRDAFRDLSCAPPDELEGQIAFSSIDWKGESKKRLRLELQYEDAGSILEQYAHGEADKATRDGTRSIRNIGSAYETVRHFLKVTLKNDPTDIRRFYGYLTNKVKIIRIETPTVAMALKIFETINDRGVGLDAMDLLKNLLFMSAKADEFARLKEIWKGLTGAIYDAGEKPLRFLRYYLVATYGVDGRLREDAIYDWFQKNANTTEHDKKPLAFATRLSEAAKAYACFAQGKNASGHAEPGIVNTQLLGGKSIKQHFILLLAGRRCSADQFSRLAVEIEKTIFAWLLSGTPGREYERCIIDAAHRLATIDGNKFDEFLATTFINERRQVAALFTERLTRLKTSDLQAYRLKYLLSKMTQYVDLQAYGPSESRIRLADYIAGGNDIEHILPANGSPEALQEFGPGGSDPQITQSLGNLLLIEKSINRSISNGRYSGKINAYKSSKFLLTKCQADQQSQIVGTADKISATVKSLTSWPTWDAAAVRSRQEYLTKLALRVWDVPSMPVA